VALAFWGGLHGNKYIFIMGTLEKEMDWRSSKFRGFLINQSDSAEHLAVDCFFFLLLLFLFFLKLGKQLLEVVQGFCVFGAVGHSEIDVASCFGPILQSLVRRCFSVDDFEIWL
jgi:hypothetical protein